ncbi:hypothetical protein GO986_12315 [Deinococcus sp. HMF7620]|uniref:Uncharacterized protein n=1 Tax=Deinococcus arboris TaxID=2682977 RepID=A0A7C9HYW2_9DEIO|nr:MULTISPECIES: hypothetical protein [Deinococcus]MBZ9752196.1 hypothetical protein [Deinococcus betulae]MVN87550.1 hypothetical protein [Deinococcus arboris]
MYAHMVRSRFTQFSQKLGVSPLTLVIWLGILSILLMVCVAGASNTGGPTNPFDSTFESQGKIGCGWVASFVSSILVRIIFFGMAIIGFVMGLARMRNGWATCAVGIVGGILSLQAIPLGKNLGIVPPQCGL